MSRIMIAMVIAASAILASCNRSEQPANQTEEKPNRTETGATRAAADGPTNVTILLSGLMVLHKDKAKGTYEVGILPAGPPHQHDFAITVDGTPKTVPAIGHFTIEVTNSTPAAANIEAKGHTGRRPDDASG